MAEATQVVDPVEALDAVGDSLHLKDCQVVWHWGHSVDLQVWGGQKLKVKGSLVGQKVKVVTDRFGTFH